MPTERHIHVIGAGGHAKVVLDALLHAGYDQRLVTLSDGNLALRGTYVLGFEIVVPALPVSIAQARFHVAIGDNMARGRIHEQALRMGGSALTIVHAAANVSRMAKLADGAFVAAGAVVGPDAALGAAVIVNHGAVVDHECTVGDFSHVAPNATLGGCVSIGTRVLVGAGANILPGVCVGDDAIVGAGAVVTRDIAAGQTWVGVPAIRAKG